MAGRLEKFSKKYGFFTSDASNEEIVAISKELSDVMYDHTKTLSKTSITLLAISIFAAIFSLLILENIEIASGTWKTALLFIRIASIAMYIAAAIFAFIAIHCAETAASISPLMWRNVRETASDEKVYEQMLAVKKINKYIYTARNYVKTASLFLLVGMALVAISFLIQRLISSGYI